MHAGIAGIGGGLGSAVALDAADAAGKKAGAASPRGALQPGTGGAPDLEAIAAKYKDNPDVTAAYAAFKAASKDGIIGPASQAAITKFLDAVKGAEAAHQPFDIAHPELAKVLPLVIGAGPALLGASSHLAGNVSQSINNALWSRAVGRGINALKSGDMGTASSMANRVQAYQDAHAPPTLAGQAGQGGSALWHNALLMGGGGMLGAEARALPSQYNANFAPPGSPAQVEGAKNQRDLLNTYLPGFGIGAVSALSGAHVPLPKFNAPIAASRGFLADVSGAGVQPGALARRMLPGADFDPEAEAALQAAEARYLQKRTGTPRLPPPSPGTGGSPYESTGDPSGSIGQQTSRASTPELPQPEPGPQQNQFETSPPPDTNKTPRAKPLNDRQKFEIQQFFKDVQAEIGSTKDVTLDDLKQRFPGASEKKLQELLGYGKSLFPVIAGGAAATGLYNQNSGRYHHPETGQFLPNDAGQ
jgi:hypothetical protein